MSRLPSKEVNLAAIAERLGISISTVSRALRNSEGIHPDTRAKIVETANEMGYTKGGPVGQISRPINVLALAQCLDETTDRDYLAGMSRAAVPMGISILSHHLQPADAAQILNLQYQPMVMRNGTLDGIVLIHRWDHEIARELSKKWPVVSIVHSYRDTAIDVVGIDDRAGMESLTSHLAADGNRRIGFFGFCRDVSWSRSRYAAYVESQLGLDLTFDPHDTVNITLDEALSPRMFENGAWAEQVLSCVKKGVKAWIAPSSTTGCTLCQFFKDKGIAIPDEVVVASYHQSIAPYPGFPQLSLMEVASEDLGAAALRRLVHRVQSPNESTRTILLPPFFVQGDTTHAETA